MGDTIKLTSARTADLMRHDPTGYYGELIDRARELADLSGVVEITEWLQAHGTDTSKWEGEDFHGHLYAAYSGRLAAKIDFLTAALEDALEISRG